MQRKGKIKYNIRDKLHSIPIMNVKSNVLYSISVCMLALCLGLIVKSNSCSALDAGDMDGTITDLQTTITPVSGGTPTPPTVSLSLSRPNMVSDTTTPGSIATVDTNVIVDVKNADSYTLTLKVDDTTMTSGNTTISAGNVINNNTWGYKWDGATSYTAPSTGGTSLTVPTVDSNGNSSFTKNLTFGVKFASDADAGHYKASGTLSLVATPKEAVITLADLTEMQQLAEGYAPEACENTPYLSGQNYSAEYTLTDIRDGNKYTVRKLGDGKCWMTQNLALRDRHASSMTSYTGGRLLNSTTSDIAANTWTLPYFSISGFSSDTAVNAYYTTESSAGATGYYTWCAATAGTCSSATSGGQHAPSSICPKGWRLPGGYNDATYGNEFYNLFNSMGLGITLNTSSNTSWSSTQLNIAQNSNYNFKYTGYVILSSFSNGTSSGYWWSSTAVSSTGAYDARVYSSDVRPGTSYGGRRGGFAVRCVAR